jgi:serine/threonine protein kinase
MVLDIPSGVVANPTSSINSNDSMGKLPSRTPALPDRTYEDSNFLRIATAISSLQLSEEQRDTLERYCRRWQSRNHLPTEIELQAIASLEGLPYDGVSAWFEWFLQVPGGSIPTPNEVPVTYQQSAPEVQMVERPSMPAERSTLLLQIMRFARAKFWKTCSSRLAQRCQGDLKYRCTSDGCDYSTNDLDSWQRHEQLWQPQHFWHCILCRQHGSEPQIITRKTKMSEHLEKNHGYEDKAQVNDLRNESEVAFAAGFEVRCKWSTKRGQCGYRFRSWEERREHYKKHFEEEVPGGPWTLRKGRDRWFDDFDDTAGSSSAIGGTSGSNNSGTGFSNGQSSHMTQSSSSSFPTGGYYNRSTPKKDTCRRSAAGIAFPNSSASSELMQRSVISSSECSTTHSTRPYSLIDVNRLCLIDPPTDAKYLALDHTLKGGSQAAVSAVSILGSSRSQGGHRRVIKLPIPFKNAMDFAKDLGYEYLWIAEVCEPACGGARFEEVLETAVLTIIPIQDPSRSTQNVQFTCRYRNLQGVYSWANSITCQHIQNLGRGSFSIVDEVMLPLSKQIFARKEVLPELSIQASRPAKWHLQEVEIMQKLRHPHIARFVAVYYAQERRSLNILMTPVAGCTLRDYLAEPGRWPDKCPHLHRWFVSLTSALRYMHSTSIAIRHKDIKPANILISGHDVFFSDFGTSEDFSASANGSQSDGSAIMTLKYCAPEVARKDRRGRKADIFSMGCVFLEMVTVLTGSTLTELHTFLGVHDDTSAFRAVYHRQLRSTVMWLVHLLHKSRDIFERKLITLCGLMLARDPDQRPSAAQVYHAIDPRTGPDSANTEGHCFCRSWREDCELQSSLDMAKTQRVLCVGEPRPWDYRLAHPSLPNNSLSNWGHKLSSDLRPHLLTRVSSFTAYLTTVATLISHTWSAKAWITRETLLTTETLVHAGDVYAQWSSSIAIAYVYFGGPGTWSHSRKTQAACSQSSLSLVVGFVRVRGVLKGVLTARKAFHKALPGVASPEKTTSKTTLDTKLAQSASHLPACQEELHFGWCVQSEVHSTTIASKDSSFSLLHWRTTGCSEDRNPSRPTNPEVPEAQGRRVDGIPIADIEYGQDHFSEFSLSNTENAGDSTDLQSTDNFPNRIDDSIIEVGDMGMEGWDSITSALNKHRSCNCRNSARDGFAKTAIFKPQKSMDVHGLIERGRLRSAKVIAALAGSALNVASLTILPGQKESVLVDDAGCMPGSSILAFANLKDGLWGSASRVWRCWALD